VKFPQLAIGQRFEWRGRVYVKSGPLAGTDVETQQTQIIPRSALVGPTDVKRVDHSRSHHPPGLSPKDVSNLLSVYREETIAWAKEKLGPEASVELMKAMEDIAHRMAQGEAFK